MSGEQPRQLRIRTAQDIIDALQSPDAAIRFAVLRAIATNPDRALRYGGTAGCDLIDELCDLAGNLPPSALHTLAHHALSAFRDPRVTAVFKNLFAASSDAALVTLAADYFASEPEEEIRSTVAAFLFQDRSYLHARVAADVMAGFTQLSNRELIRIAILTVKESPQPATDEASDPCWLAELRGMYKSQAQAALEGCDEGGFLLCKRNWDSFDDEEKAWVLAWGAASFPALTVELVLASLDWGRDELLLAALESIALFGPASSMFTPRLGRFLTHENPRVRAVVAGLGGHCPDMAALFYAETDSAVKAALLPGLVRFLGSDAVPLLIGCLEAEDYRLRAAAVAGLTGCAPETVEMVKPLLLRQEQGIRVAAAQVLLDAGEEAVFQQVRAFQ